jgi:molybdopterin/thiamine biosynthesis adenylyltransferase/rhodanese-related sulfurtransferase
MQTSPRYNRQTILPEIGVEGQEKLKKTRVLVIGAGGLGCPILQYLNAVGVGTLGIIDDDTVSVSNLQRQILYTEDEVEMLKVDAAKRRLLSQNSETNIETYPYSIDKQNALEIIDKYDIVVDGCDNFATRYLVNDACVILKKKWVFGSILKFEGQVSVFDGEVGPTYRCLFPDIPTDSPDCNTIGVIGTLPGVIGMVQANEVVKLIVGFGELLKGKLWVMDTLTMSQRILKFRTNQENLQLKDFQTDELGVCQVENDKEEIDVFELKEFIDNKLDFTLVDVREKFEFQTSNIGGLNYPLNSIPERFYDFEQEKTLVLLCHHGVRSMHALRFLKAQIPTLNVVSVKGGIDAYSRLIDASIPRY